MEWLNSFVDRVIIIHCAHRKDRLKNVEEFIKKSKLSKVTILDATYLPKNGAKGCSHSHYRAMKTAIESGWRRIMVIEDDYWIDDVVTCDQTLKKEISGLPDWDVVQLWWLLNGLEKRTVRISDHLRRVNHHRYGASSTICYMVNGPEMMHKLSAVFLESYDSFKDVHDRKQKNLSADAIWAPLQKDHKWLLMVPKMGRQIDTPSDVHTW